MAIHNTPPTHLITQSPSIYKSARIKTISSSQKKITFKLDYRETLSSPKIRKNNEQFNSCYYGILFDYCHSCVSGLCTIHYTIKCNSECERIFHVSCNDINKNNFLYSCKTKQTTCFEIYSSVDKIKLLTTKWFCVR